MSGIARRLARLEAKRGAARPLECWVVYDTDDDGPIDEEALAAAKAKAEAEGRRIRIIRVVYEDTESADKGTIAGAPDLKRL